MVLSAFFCEIISNFVPLTQNRDTATNIMIAGEHRPSLEMAERLKRDSEEVAERVNGAWREKECITKERRYDSIR